MSFKDDKIGALWKKDNRMSGVITIDGKKTNIVCFANKFKVEGDTKPDYNILISKPMAKPEAASQSEPVEGEVPVL